jgi:hypothetical protein
MKYTELEEKKRIFELKKSEKKEKKLKKQNKNVKR